MPRSKIPFSEQLWNVTQATKYLGISVVELLETAQGGGIPYTPSRKGWLFKVKDLMIEKALRTPKEKKNPD